MSNTSCQKNFFCLRVVQISVKILGAKISLEIVVSYFGTEFLAHQGGSCRQENSHLVDDVGP